MTSRSAGVTLSVGVIAASAVLVIGTVDPGIEIRMDHSPPLAEGSILLGALVACVW